MDCFSGASGDMLLSAMLDAGLDRSALEAGLAQIGITSSSLVINHQTQHGITGTSLTVEYAEREHPVRNLPVVPAFRIEYFTGTDCYF